MERFDNRAISIITRREAMVGADADLVELTRLFFERFKLIALDDAIANRALELRRAHRIMLPEAVIRATVQAAGRLLVTRNTKDYPTHDPAVRDPYAL
jgi:predicted nucleic acid-binding protein